MKWPPNTSLRNHLIAAVVLTTLPLMLLISYGARRQFDRDTRNLEEEVQRLTVFIAGDVSHLLDATRQMLIAVADIDRAANPERVKTILNELAQHCPFYMGFDVVTVTGGAYSTKVSYGGTARRVDENLIRRAIASKKLVIGPFVTDAPGGTNLLYIAYLASEACGTNGPIVAFTALDLLGLDVLLTEARVAGSKSLFPRDMTLNILNRSGTILTRYPDKNKWTGRKFPDTKVLEEIVGKGEGAADLVGVDGLSRFYAFQSVKDAAGELFVCIGVSRDSALAAERQDQRRSLAAVFAVGLLLILGAWFGTRTFILRPVAALVNAAQHLGAGDLSVRTGISNGPREIKRLANAFDHMAETLQRDAHEREQMRTKLVDYDRQLRSMAVETALVEESERRQIAAELHDKAGPLLATCYMRLGRLLKSAMPERVAATIVESREFLEHALGELRSLTFDLSSPTLYTLGLTAAVEELCHEIAKNHALAIAFRDQGAPNDLPNEQRIILYRAARELLFNVIKHAEATRVTVTCGGDAEENFVSVEDNGLGFDATEVGRGFSRTGGFGLFNLRERLDHLGGRFTVKSSRGAGTRVEVALPVPSLDEQE